MNWLLPEGNPVGIFIDGSTEGLNVIVGNAVGRNVGRSVSEVGVVVGLGDGPGDSVGELLNVGDALGPVGSCDSEGVIEGILVGTEEIDGTFVGLGEGSRLSVGTLVGFLLTVGSRDILGVILGILVDGILLGVTDGITPVGSNDGVTDKDKLGLGDSTFVDSSDGLNDENFEGLNDRCIEGKAVGESMGSIVLAIVSFPVGVLLGDTEGDALCEFEGFDVGSIDGIALCLMVGNRVEICDGVTVLSSSFTFLTLRTEGRKIL